MNNLCRDKYQKCPYMPNMDIKNKEEIIEDEYGVKHRKTPKIFKCLFDNHPFRWDVTCPREIIEVKSSEYEQEYEDD